jgi:hypothetical protein
MDLTGAGYASLSRPEIDASNNTISLEALGTRNLNLEDHAKAIRKNLIGLSSGEERRD